MMCRWTTVSTDEDVMQAARALAAAQRRSLGKVTEAGFARVSSDPSAIPTALTPGPCPR